MGWGIGLASWRRVVDFVHTSSGDPLRVECDAVVLITGRTPNDQIATELSASSDRRAAAGLRSVRTIGDAWVPSTIASAAWWGHRYARVLEVDEPDILFRREGLLPVEVRSRSREYGFEAHSPPRTPSRAPHLKR